MGIREFKDGLGTPDRVVKDVTPPGGLSITQIPLEPPKMKQPLDGYAVQNTTTKELIGVDYDSGGYPYIAFGISTVKVWPKLEEALEYCRTNNWDGRERLKPVKVQLTVSEIHTTKHMPKKKPLEKTGTQH